jgi:hypothetical protein
VEAFEAEAKTMNCIRKLSRPLLVSIFWTCVGAVAVAADLSGRWVTSLDACDKMFVIRGGHAYLAPDADIHGSGFVVDGTIIRGKMATCKITSRRDQSQIIHLQGTCATDILVSNNKVDLKMIDQNKLMRTVPGIPEMDTPYYRCPQ